jgi:Sensors of blue-light using FAD
MFQLIYTSTEREDFSSADLKKLLMRSRLRNSEVGVTGMLMHHERRFLQLLEGEQAAVGGIFARIEADHRHRDIFLLHHGAMSGERLFGDWSMGFADAGGAARILKGFIDLKNSGLTAALDKSRAIDILVACGREVDRLSA